MPSQATTALKNTNSRPASNDLDPAEGLRAKEVTPPEGSSTSDAPSSGPIAASARPALDDDWPTLAVLSRRYIGRALEHTGGNKTRAADLLGIDRRTLNRILARERARQAAAAAQASR